MSLGDWIRVVRTFVGAFAPETVADSGQVPAAVDMDRDKIEALALIRDLKVPSSLCPLRSLTHRHVVMLNP